MTIKGYVVRGQDRQLKGAQVWATADGVSMRRERAKLYGDVDAAVGVVADEVDRRRRVQPAPGDVDHVAFDPRILVQVGVHAQPPLTGGSSASRPSAGSGLSARSRAASVAIAEAFNRPGT